MFISYAREDVEFVRRLCDRLDEDHRRAWVDWEGIPPSADWMREIRAAIEGCNCFIFVMSASSLASTVCRSEVAHAIECRKRLVPMVWGAIDESQVAPELRSLNWIISRDAADFPATYRSLIAAVDTDLEWVRDHTRLLVRAIEWRDEREDPSFLLNGADLREAESWLSRGADKKPKPTELHARYVLASRTRETRRSRQLLSGVTVALVLAVGLAVLAWIQRSEAVRQRLAAERQTATALSNQSDASLTRHDELDALVAAVQAGGLLRRNPSLAAPSLATWRTLGSLRRAVTRVRERHRIASGQFRGVTQLAFTPDGASLYTVGGGGDVKKWRLTGELESSFETEHSGMGDGCTSVVGFGVSPDGQTLVTVGSESRVALWSPGGGKIASFDVDVSGDGVCSAIGSAQIDFATRTMTLQGWDGSSGVWSFDGKKLRTGKSTPAANERRLVDVKSPDRMHGARETEDGGVEITRKGTVVAALPRQRTPAFSRRGDLLATVANGVDDGMVHLWEVALPPVDAPRDVAQRPAKAAKRTVLLDGRRVAADPTTSFGGHPTAVSPDGRPVAATTDDTGGIALWRIRAGSDATDRVAAWEVDQIASADFSSAIDEVTFSPDSTLLATGGTDGTIKIWDVTGQLVRTLVAHDQYAGARFSPDQQLLVTWGDNAEGRTTLKLWAVTGELLEDLSTEQAHEAWFSPDGRWLLASLGDPQKVQSWSLDLERLMTAGCAALRLRSDARRPPSHPLALRARAPLRKSGWLVRRAGQRGDRGKGRFPALKCLSACRAR